MEDFGPFRHQVGGDAQERNGQIVECERVLIANRDGGQQIPDVDARDHTGWKTAPQIVPGPLQGCPVRVGQKTLGEPLPCIIEREGDHVGLLLLVAGEGKAFAGNPVAEHDIPVDASDQAFHVVRAVSQGIHASHQTAHGGAQDHVDGNAQRFDIPDGADVCGSFCPAAAKNQGNGGSRGADAVHLCADPLAGQGIPFRGEPEAGPFEGLALR